MSKQILKALAELLEANVISEDEASRIRNYYASKAGTGANRLFLVFAILGALLVGMGIVLIVAHNWDELPKVAKLAIGLAPMLIGQGLAAWLVFKGDDRPAWREGCGVFLCFGVALSISIVSQVYNIEGNFARFLLAWMVLTLPVIYVLRSSATSLLNIAGITWFLCEAEYFSYFQMKRTGWPYWLLLAAVLPYYYITFVRPGRKNNFFHFHSWLIMLSVTISLGSLSDGAGDELMVIAYMALFSTFVLLSELPALASDRLLTNPFLVGGSLGTIALLLLVSFEDYWTDIARDVSSATNITVAAATVMVACLLLLWVLRQKSWKEINTKAFAFVVMAVLFFIGLTSPATAQLLANVAILAFSVYTIRDGAQRNHLGILNYGLFIITALILCRFFDTDFSFVVRGVLFIAVGVGFFAANYYFIKKRKDNL